MIFRKFSVLISLMWLQAAALLAAVESSAKITVVQKTRQGCNLTCENSKVQIPFPFGIGPHCYHNKSYEIVCKSSSNSSTGAKKPFLKKFKLEVLKIIDCFNVPSFVCDMPKLEVASHWETISITGTSNEANLLVGSSLDLKGTPFSLSTEENVFVAKGCGGQAIIMNRSRDIMAGCASVCPFGSDWNSNDDNSSCGGLGCCSRPLPEQPSQWIDFYQIGLKSSGSRGGSAVRMKIGFMNKDNSSQSSLDPFPTVWYWNPPPLQDVIHDLDHHDCEACESHAPGTCIPRCWCSYLYIGNPYLPHGCQDPCKLGITDLCIQLRLLKSTPIPSLALGLGTIVFLLCCCGLCFLIRRRRQIKRRAKFFKRNGGLLLQQQMNSPESTDRTRVFTAAELEKATDNFNASRVLGEGGQGTVYKGMLTDGRVVAIKKSKEVDESQVEHFINEVAILSQINHRNVVKLLGCCLETEVPLLVYEFIPNGTLSQHIHNTNNHDFHITWKMRLLIAAESAGAIAYLHSSSATPIYHRDIKSSNILLDDKYQAKVSDFGTSRTVVIDQTHLTTLVRGTFGYLDPEYFRSHQFTEKSDVYSFGVVLVELLTGKKPVFTADSEGPKSLSLEFLYHMENSSLFEIVDRRILEEAKEEEIGAVANLAKRCLNMNGKQRPMMKEVGSAIEAIRLSSTMDNVPTEDNQMVMDISRIHSNNDRSDTMYSNNGIGTSSSIDET